MLLPPPITLSVLSGIQAALACSNQASRVIKPDLAGNRKAQFFASIFRVGRTLAEYLAANLARNLPGTQKKPTRDLPGTYRELTRDLPGTYQEPTRNLPGTFQEPTRNLPRAYGHLPVTQLTRNLPGTYQEHTRDLPGTYQESTRNLPETLKIT